MFLLFIILIIAYEVKADYLIICEGTITDKYNYKLAGIQLKASYENQIIANGYTIYDGSFNIKGKSKSKTLVISLIATLVDHNYS